jgi:hypothetical protein
MVFAPMDLPEELYSTQFAIQTLTGSEEWEDDSSLRLYLEKNFQFISGKMKTQFFSKPVSTTV